jgi:hypothetical protein
MGHLHPTPFSEQGSSKQFYLVSIIGYYYWPASMFLERHIRCSEVPVTKGLPEMFGSMAWTAF